MPPAPSRNAFLAFGSAYHGVPALVLGASGFIGAWVTRLLDEAGANVSVVVRDSATTPRTWCHARPTVIQRDLTQRGAVAAVVADTRPAVVFNLAGYGVDRRERESSPMTALNADLVGELASRLGQQPDRQWSGARLVHVGSALEYGDGATSDGRLSERTEPAPSTEYGQSKLSGTRHVQRVAQSTGMSCLVARVFNVYGPGEHDDRLLPSLQRAAISGGRVALTLGRQLRDFAYIEDVAEGLLRLAISPVQPGEIVNLATGRLTSVRVFAETAASVLGIGPDHLDFGALTDRDDSRRHDVVDIGRLHQLTGWTPPTTIADGIRRSSEHTRDC